MTKAADLVARMAQLGGSPPAATAPPALSEREPEPSPANGRRRPLSAGKVRVTVDLEPELHRSLRIYALERRVDASAVLRALLELLEEDQVADLVAGRLFDDRIIR